MEPNASVTVSYTVPNNTWKNDGTNLVRLRFTFKRQGRFVKTNLIVHRKIRDHVTRFHELMFTLSPQKQTIQENLDRAFNLADRSAFDYSQDLAEKGYYARIVSANISQQMLVDSVCFMGNGYPWQVIEGRRSDVNPHGLLIEKFKVISNDLIETRK